MAIRTGDLFMLPADVIGKGLQDVGNLAWELNESLRRVKDTTASTGDRFASFAAELADTINRTGA